MHRFTPTGGMRSDGYGDYCLVDEARKSIPSTDLLSVCLLCLRSANAERDRLRALIVQIKEECVQAYIWGKNITDAMRAIEHLTACGLDPAPNTANRQITNTPE